MDVSSIQRPLAATDVPMEQLAGNSHLTEEQKIGEATRQFEAILLRKILDEAQKTVIHSKYSDDSTAAGIYRDFATTQLADSISKSGEFGMGKKLEQEFTRSLHRTSTEHNSTTPTLKAPR